MPLSDRSSGTRATASRSARTGCLGGQPFRTGPNQIASVNEREVEQRDDLFLDLGLEVNPQVPATDQVQLGERRVADQVLRSEDNHITQPFGNMITVIVGLGEETPEPLGRNVAYDTLGIDSPAGVGNASSSMSVAKIWMLVATLAAANCSIKSIATE